jgi:pantothenate kinase
MVLTSVRMSLICLVVKGHCQCKNTEVGFNAFAKALPKETLVVMEAEVESVKWVLKSCGISYSYVHFLLVNITRHVRLFMIE